MRFVGADVEFAVDGGLGERFRLGNQAVDRVDAVIEVILDGVEIAVVVVGDLRGNIARGNAIDVVGGHVQRSDDGVQRVVHALNDLAVVALMLVRVGTGRKLSLDARLGKHRRRRLTKAFTASMHWFRLFLIVLKSPL